MDKTIDTIADFFSSQLKACKSVEELRGFISSSGSAVLYLMRENFGKESTDAWLKAALEDDASASPPTIQ